MPLIDKEELYQIATAFLAITVALVIMHYGGLLGLGKMTLHSLAVNFAITGFTVGMAFLLHELAHKFVAMRFGMKARFRAFGNGIALMMLMAFFPIGFMFLAPGAVFISSRSTTTKQNGIISLAGPAMNIALAIVFMWLINSQAPFLLPGKLGIGIAQDYADLFGFAKQINLMLALFNMIPFFILDGAKIMSWDWRIWLATVVTTIALFTL